MDSKNSTASCVADCNLNAQIKLNIGGKFFETTISTLQSAGPISLLASISSTTTQPVFIDRDPDIFSCVLSLLRSHRLPSNALRRFSLHQLLNEFRFFGLNSSLLSPPPLSPFDASFTNTLSPPSSPLVSTFSASSPSSILLAHSGQISFFDPTTLSLFSTLRTHLDDISSIASISPEISVVGSYTSSGLHFYTRKNHLSSLYWDDDCDTRVRKSRVTAVADSMSDGVDSVSTVFSAAFECKHGENAVLIIDKSTLKVVTEIGRQSGNSAKSSAIKKLRWVPRVGLLVGSSVNCGAFGYSGYVRVWDPRSGEMVWETNEPGGVIRSSRLGDTMADIDVDLEGLFLAKVGSKTGELGVADLRKLDSDDPWVYLDDPNPGLNGNWKLGGSVVVHCYKGNVFVGRDDGLEAWSRVGDGGVGRDGDGGDGDGGDRSWGVYRRNYVDKAEDGESGIIRKIEGGGNRLFVSRENVEGVQVLETSHCSGVKDIKYYSREDLVIGKGH